MTTIQSTTRRSFLQAGLVGLACALTTPVAAAVPHLCGARSLNLHNVHTDEKLHVKYWQDGHYDRSAWERINHILRDYRTGTVYPMNVRLMDLLFDLQHRVKNDRAIEIISGYRSPETNKMLANLSDGVAKRSYHTKGMAIDINMPGTSLSKIHTTALAMRRGGVGYYPDSQFVHVDVGPLRTW